MTLSDDEQAVLLLEREWWSKQGAKEQAIADTFGMTATAYYALLNRLIDRPEALASEPVVVNRLRERRAKAAERRRRLRQ